MSVPSWFLRLSPSEQAGLVARAEAGLIDPLPFVDEAAAIVVENEEQNQPLPGGTTYAEKAAYADRVKAGLVDRRSGMPPIDWAARDRALPEHDALSPFQPKRQFRRAYPWQA